MSTISSCRMVIHARAHDHNKTKQDYKRMGHALELLNNASIGQHAVLCALVESGPTYIAGQHHTHTGFQVVTWQGRLVIEGHLPKCFNKGWFEVDKSTVVRICEIEYIAHGTGIVDLKSNPPILSPIENMQRNKLPVPKIPRGPSPLGEAMQIQPPQIQGVAEAGVIVGGMEPVSIGYVELDPVKGIGLLDKEGKPLSTKISCPTCGGEGFLLRPGKTFDVSLKRGWYVLIPCDQCHKYHSNVAAAQANFKAWVIEPRTDKSPVMTVRKTSRIATDSGPIAQDQEKIDDILLA